MKKRIISFLLVLVISFSLGVSAFADKAADAEKTTEVVTIKKGDTLYSICKARGYNYNTYKELLLRLNNKKDEKELAKIYANKTIEVPVSKEAADALMESLNIKSAGKAKKDANAFIVGDASKVPEGDSAKYYLVSYALKKDENLSNLFKSWGMKFSDVSEQVLSLNNLSDFNHIAAGKGLLLPTTKLDLTGYSYYTVMEHTVRKGDTAYSICSSYGLDYDKVLTTLERFNPGVTFTKIRVDQKLYIPVAGLYGVQPAPASELSPAPGASDYTGNGVIMSISPVLSIRPEQGSDFNLAILSGSFPTGYTPRIGDYVMFCCDTATNTLKAIKYIYNVFDANK